MGGLTLLLYLILSSVITFIIIWYSIHLCYENNENDRQKLNEVTNDAKI